MTCAIQAGIELPKSSRRECSSSGGVSRNDATEGADGVLINTYIKAQCLRWTKETSRTLVSFVTDWILDYAVQDLRPDRCGHAFDRHGCGHSYRYVSKLH